MLYLTNITIDGGRISDDPRTHLTDNGKPCFGWALLGKGRFQASYRLRIFSGTEILHDSGEVFSTEQSAEYQGPSLPRGKRLLAEITVTADTGERSLPEKFYFFNACIEWNASWIGVSEDIRGKTVYLRKRFFIGEPVESAVLYACGIGYMQVTINGSRPDESELDPAHTDYTKTCQYVPFLGTGKLLRQGENVVGVLLGEGWRRNCFFGGEMKNNYSFMGQPAFSCMMHITYASGKEEWIRTDSRWECGRGAHVSNDIFNGETYDARKRIIGWDTPAFSGFDGKAVTLNPPGGKMVPMVLPAITPHAKRNPIAIWEQNGFVFCDFGINLAGVVRLRLPKCMRSGQKITLAHAEELENDGTLWTANLRSARAEDVYIASGDDRDEPYFQPIFTYHGFRYLRIEGLGYIPETQDITAIELRTDMDNASDFRCGNSLATKIHEICVNTERANQHSILTDCPQRDERQGWMNDATSRFDETPYNFDIGRMFTKVIRDLLDTQSADGAITSTAPYVWGGRPADGVCSSFIVAGIRAYLHCGNTRILKEAYPGFSAWEKCLQALSENRIITFSRFGDWAGPEYACPGAETAQSAVTPGEFMTTACTYYNCIMLSRIADILGKYADTERWNREADEIRDAMLAKWYDGNTAKMHTGSQACQAFSLWLGIIPEQDRKRAANLIHNDLVQNGYKITTGNLCTRYMLQALTDNGYGEDAWKLITREEYPSFGYMIQHEATTVWERLEMKRHPGMNSHNHPMYGASDVWFWNCLLGIRITGAGVSKVHIEPFLPESLQSAQGKMDTVKGELNVHWFKRWGKAYLHANIPFGTEAEIKFGGKTCTVHSGFHVFESECASAV